MTSLNTSRLLAACTLGGLFTLAALGLLVWGGMKLLGNDSKRIR